MNLFSKETGIRLAVVNVLLFCVLLFTLYYAEEHNLIDLLSDSSPNKLTDEELSQMVWTPSPRQKESIWNKKKHLELEKLRDILILVTNRLNRGRPGKIAEYPPRSPNVAECR